MWTVECGPWPFLLFICEILSFFVICNMKLLQVPRLYGHADLGNQRFPDILDAMPREAIAVIPWKEFAYRPDVRFCMGYTSGAIFLKFFVTEMSLRAQVTEINGNVWEDSCVEFFISFDDQGYYNIECNCIGTIHAAFGKARRGRILLEKKLIGTIGKQVIIRNREDEKEWQLALALPLSVFVHHRVHSLQGVTCRANFYKCGDLLPEPHFVSWTPIDTAEPDFHVPQFFGTLQFE